MHEHKNVIVGIMGNLLPPEERQQFKKFTANMASADFFNILSVYFTDAEIRTALQEYICNNLSQIEAETGAKIDAVVGIYGAKINYGCFNEEMGI